MAPVAKILQEPNPCDWIFDIILSIPVHDILLHTTHRIHMVPAMIITYSLLYLNSMDLCAAFVVA